MATVINPWITIIELRNGVTVQRKFGGMDAFVNENNEVTHCSIKYWERELYPNDAVIKTELKWYTLQDLAPTETDEYTMEALPVLSGFVASLGKPGIIDPCRETLSNTEILPLTSENGYPLRRDTRFKIMK